MKSGFCVILCLSATQLAAAEPVRLCNVANFGGGSPVVELVLRDDRVFVGLGVEEGGGDLVTLHEPGRFAQTWERLQPGLAELQGTALVPDAATLYDMLEVHFADGSFGRWVGTGSSNPVGDVIATFGMNEARSYTDHTVTQVGADHPVFTDPCGDWP